MKTTTRTIAALLVSLGIHGVSANVQVELRSSWPPAPSFLESIETIAIEEPDAFFPLIHALANPETLPEPPLDTSEEVYKYALSVATSEGLLGEPGAYASVEMNLALHAATPRIEAFYQYYTDRHAARNTEENCDSWVDWYGQVVCDAKTLAHLAGVETIDASEKANTTSTYARPQILTFDHIRPDPARVLEPPPRTAVLYASLSSPNFWELHEYLYGASKGTSPHVEYVFRPIPEAGRNGSARTALSGYGVALDLKKMDYLALDDRHQGLRTEDSEADEGADVVYAADPIVALLQQYPENTTVDASTPLADEEFALLGLQATQLIQDASEPLSALRLLTQNFPKYAASLARRVPVDERLLGEVERNHAKAQPGLNVIWLNGLPVLERDMTPFGLLRLLRKERATMQSLTALGLSRVQAFELLTHPSMGEAQSESGVLDGLFDASDRPEGGDVVVWWNDLEKDNRYARWGNSLRMLLRPMYPGQFPNVRFNIFNVVAAVDLSQTSSLSFIGSTVSNLISRGLPFTWGVMPIVETEDGARMARLFYYLIDNFGRTKTMNFIKSVAQLEAPLHRLTPKVNWSLVRSEYNALLAQEDALPEAVEHDLETILAGTADDLQGPRAYAARLGTTLAEAPQGHVFVNGKHFNLDDDFLRHLQAESAQQMQFLQEQLFAGKLSDDDAYRISTFFYDQPSAAKRRNLYVFPSNKPGSLRIFALPDLIDKSGFPDHPESFIYPPNTEVVPLTTYVVADLDSEQGLLLVKEALNSLKADSPSRFSFIHNPSNSDPLQNKPGTAALLAQFVTDHLLHRVSPERLLRVLGLSDSVPLEEGDQVVLPPDDSLEDILDEASAPESLAQYARACRFLIRDLGLQPGEQGLIMNGRFIGPIQPGAFLADDFELLEAYEIHKRVGPVVGALQTQYESLDQLDRGAYASLVATASSILSHIQLPDPSEVGLFNAPQQIRRRNYQLLEGEFTRLSFGDNTTAFYHVGVLIDPLTDTAQKWLSLVEWLLNIPELYVELHINPSFSQELPLKRLYRYNLQPRLLFDGNGSEIPAQATFNDIPVEPIYTLGMDVPQSWLVRPREALYDLDNIQLSSLPLAERANGVRAVYGLDYLVVEGHAREEVTQAAPRGVQLQLTTNDGTPIADTLVMANLGYLQFRTAPGVFRLEIRPGRGRDIYRMESVGNEGWNSQPVDNGGQEITLTSFEGLTLYPRLARLPGMERADVLAPEHPQGSHGSGLIADVISRVSGFFSSSKAQNEVELQQKQADINIFTVASGLLYERFASIMILSVLRNTNSSVKFWFIENFLSPAFLEFIPHFAEAYNFQYELVTYKWPSWLRAQKEKQRTIWGYKILFLDVLFPMDLKKVIFVDADQIVRADLHELVELDLQGAPYAYTPMGDDNEEMEGFRFWKTGYWKDFLQGLPYHISALYVVDLVRFRQIAAGDILRGHYQQLSLDPNSLANLDQDLPNNLQREVRIFSLPEDWLWCETWCSKDRLDRAKTIDLCQNPLTKEPKLSRARQIPEWEEYDAEIAHFARELAERGLIRSGIIATDANVLADASASHGPVVAEDEGEADVDARRDEEEHQRDEL